MITCDRCKKQYEAKPEYAGKTLKCKCGNSLTFATNDSQVLGASADNLHGSTSAQTGATQGKTVSNAPKPTAKAALGFAIGTILHQLEPFSLRNWADIHRLVQVIAVVAWLVSFVAWVGWGVVVLGSLSTPFELLALLFFAFCTCVYVGLTLCALAVVLYVTSFFNGVIALLAKQAAAAEVGQ